MNQIYHYFRKQNYEILIYLNLKIFHNLLRNHLNQILILIIVQAWSKIWSMIYEGSTTFKYLGSIC